MLEQLSSTAFGSVGLSLVAFIGVLSVIVVIHELGHYWAGRLCGMSIDAFSLGFGKELYARVDKHGVRWRVAMLPLGGYVKFTGDENGASIPDPEKLSGASKLDQSNWFHFKPLWQRAFVIAAGPIANFILAIVVFTFLFSVFGRPVTLPYVDEVMAGSAAQEAGFESGDLIVAIDGVGIESFNALTRVIADNGGQNLTITLDRNGTQFDVDVTPKVTQITDRFGAPLNIGRLGISRLVNPDTTTTTKDSLVGAFERGVGETWYVIARTLTFIGELFTGSQSVKQLGGPVKIAEVSGVAAQNGLVSLLQLTAFISISIGIFNLLPVPPLDGGHLFFYAIEAVIRRPVDERIKMVGFQIGIACMLALMVFATWNDLSSIYSRWIGA